MRKFARAIAWLTVALAICAQASWAGELIETTSLEADVGAGKVPAIAERLPENPRVINLKDMGREPGRHGGEIRMLMGKQKDIRMMTVYGYARFVTYNDKFELVPDIVESFDVEESRIFTFRLRKGHKWSDGHPFTAADVKYAWEYVITDPELSGGSQPAQLLVDGKPPKFEVLDEQTVRFTWHAANPDFLPALAAPRPIFLAKPAHYMKTFHKHYQDPAKLEALIAEASARNWRGLHIRKGRQYRPENPELPTLDPWRNTTKPPSERFVFARNPYFHRIDENGRQLPYADQVVMSMGSTGLIPAKAGAGETDLQARYIRFDNFTFLKEAEKQGKIEVKLWRTGKGSQMALMPNLNVEDPVWRALIRDVRFRRALSLAIDREEINDVVYLGLAQPSADTILSESPLFKEEFQQAWSQFDPDKANALLDEIGLTERNNEEIRLLPNGEAANLIVENAGESTEQSDLLELIADHLAQVGIRMIPRASQRDVMRKRVFAGKTVMSVWSGMDNAV
ncbi:MAG: ABC transporter substrate-binding protein, partial [Hyphomicrobiales bacterium]|nr:ABC transporter substrate-binding protein [Hyphomicrobiales bacterium]